MHSLHTNGAVPHALEDALLLRGAGLGALETEALTGLPAEGTSSIAKSKASVVKEAESHTRRHDGGFRYDDWGSEEGRRAGSADGRDR